SALQERQRIVEQRFEKRKSLAHKALDLHFALNHEGNDYGSKPLAGLVDWINYAPLGTIKRAHRLLKNSVGEEQIVTSALVDIITGVREATPEDEKFVRTFAQKAIEQDSFAYHRLRGMAKVGNILSRFNYKVSLADVEKIAGQESYGMTDALKIYDLDQVRQFLNQGVNLQSVVAVKKTTEKFGHDLRPVDVATMATRNIIGLESALRAFSFPDVQTLLSQDVSLPTAEAVLHNTKQFGYELSIQKIAQVAKNVRDVGDFTDALRELPLEEVNKLFTVGVSYRNFGTVKVALEKHGLSSDFDATLAVSQILVRTGEYAQLDGALEVYSLSEIEQIISGNVKIDLLLNIRLNLEKRNIMADLKETIMFTKAAQGQYWLFGECIDTFGIENVRKMVTKSVNLSKVMEVNRYLNGQSRSLCDREIANNLSESTRATLRKGGLDVIIAIAKAGSIEAVTKTLSAGFTVEDIIRFPYLISPLIAKK
ncbi:hypothetical protein IT409_00705, partial [Candidatus Falkowbacteria bacterium]|nr:hypothetical protein [Candidatus Falkowbacteria bacterium]